MPTTAKALPVLAAAAALWACAAHRVEPPADRAAAPPAEPIAITIVGTNDVHGWVEPHQETMADGTPLHWGGSAAFAGQLALLRAENPDGVVLVDAGDMFQGTLEANLSEGEAIIAVYNALGYDAVALGNHEFDYGPVGPKSASADPTVDPLGALRARAKQAKFPLLAYNVYVGATEQRPDFVEPHGLIVIQRRGLRIGIAGLANPATPTVTNPLNVRALRFGPLVEQARAAAEDLKRQGADLRVLVVHEGGECTPPSAQEQGAPAHCQPSELFRALDALPEGLFDAVIAGHTHQFVATVVHGMPVIESYAHGSHFGTIQLMVDPKTRRPIADKTVVKAGRHICDTTYDGVNCSPHHWKGGPQTRPAMIGARVVVPDKAVTALLDPYEKQVEGLRSRPLGVKVEANLTRGKVGEGPLGTTLAELLRQMEHTDIAMLNSGGIRADIPAGDLTYGEFFEALPFDNSVVVLTLTRAEILSILETLGAAAHGLPETSGLIIEGYRCPGRVTITRLALANGKPLSDRATYRLATSDFLALGGDGLGPAMDRIPANRKDFGLARELNMREALVEYLSKRGGVLAPTTPGNELNTLQTCPAEPAPPAHPPPPAQPAPRRGANATKH